MLLDDYVMLCLLIGLHGGCVDWGGVSCVWGCLVYAWACVGVGHVHVHAHTTCGQHPPPHTHYTHIFMHTLTPPPTHIHSLEQRVASLDFNQRDAAQFVNACSVLRYRLPKTLLHKVLGAVFKVCWGGGVIK